VEVRVHPLCYSEFLQFHDLPDTDESLMSYLNYGGLPGLRNVGLGSNEQVWDYLTSVFNTIMLKDIIERHDIRNIPFLNNLIAFYADTTGKLTSANSISKYMKSQEENVSSNLILLYRGFYAEAYLIDVVPRYDIHGKKIFESNEKVYLDNLRFNPQRDYAPRLVIFHPWALPVRVLVQLQNHSGIPVRYIYASEQSFSF